MCRDPSAPRRLLQVLLAAAVLSFACGSGTSEPENPSVTGNWVGTGVSAGALENWRFNLEEARDGSVTGSFSLRVERLVFSGDLSGNHSHPDLSLDLHMVVFGEIVPAIYQGQVTSAESITGTVSFFGDPARTLDLDRSRP